MGPIRAAAQRSAPVSLNTTALLGVCAFAIYWVFDAFSIFAHDYTEIRDFRSFYLSAADYWYGSGFLYEPRKWLNLNGPHTSLLLFSPLVLFDLHTAAIVWLMISAVLLIATLAIIRTELQLPANRMAWVVAALFSSTAMHHQLRQGQIGIVLMFVSTLAWRAARRGSASSSWWLALAISLKPPILATWLLTQRRREALRTLLIGGAGVVLGVVLIGAENWRGWVAVLEMTGGSIAPWIENVGFLGLVAKVGNPYTYEQPAYVRPIAMVLSVAASAFTWRSRQGSLDRSWLLWGLLGILISPIAWAYYLLVITGPLVAWGEKRGWPLVIRLALVLFAVPWPIVVLLWSWHPLFGVINALGVLVLWAAVASDGGIATFENCYPVHDLTTSPPPLV
jgi:hypothetical protein